MSSPSFSAAEQSLGYSFQSRFALLKALDLPEDGLLYIERDDDVEFISAGNDVSLASLKHKAVGDRLTDLSLDFWKSVRIWLEHYNNSGKIASSGRYLLFSTATVSPDSFLRFFVEGGADDTTRSEAAIEALEQSQSVAIAKIRSELNELAEEETADFYSRITIFPSTLRINEVPSLIDSRLRTVRREFRRALFERLEGWWNDLVIRLLTGERVEPIRIQEVSDKLASLADEYRADNLPITFRNRLPSGGTDAVNDQRTFVEQLRILALSEKRLEHAIIDYYRAYEQRSSWARENLLVSGEIEEYEDRLVEEWARHRAIICENITNESGEDACRDAGRALYLWAETETGALRIRERVTEQYVVRGTFHILANSNPSPRVYWHPRFLKRLADILETAA